MTRRAVLAIAAGLVVLGTLVAVALGVPGSPLRPGDEKPPGRAGSSPDVAPTVGPSVRPPDTRGRPVPAGRGPHPGSRPNIVLITSDDQTAAELAFMPRTLRLLGERGLELTEALSTHPLCCPARAEILTGEYAQNNGVRHNEGPFGGYTEFLDHNGRDHLATWLGAAGYHTGFTGKALNGNAADGRRMPGWDVWDPTTRRTYAYTDVTFENDGSPEVPEGYVADVVADRTSALIERFAQDDAPFFIWSSHVGPHDSFDDGAWGPPVAADRHADLFEGLVPPAEGLPDEPATALPRPVRRLAERSRTGSELVDVYRQRARSLQAIDEATATVVSALEAAGELRDTLIVFTSDNGFQIGEHGLSTKNVPYEESLRVPMLIRGPGIPQRSVSHAPARMVDLAPTFLDLAGTLRRVSARGHLDGVSLLSAMHGRTVADTSLIQAGTDEPAALRRFGWWWRGVRTKRYTWVLWHTGEQELYDRKVDPRQLENLIDREGRVDPGYAAVRDQLRRRYLALADCSGATACQRRFGPLPSPGR